MAAIAVRALGLPLLQSEGSMRAGGGQQISKMYECYLPTAICHGHLPCLIEMLAPSEISVQIALNDKS